jgi:O-antigen/teichoic acid export membrane protein
LLVLALTTLVVDVGGKSASTYLVLQQRSVLYSALGLARMLLTIALNIFLVMVLQLGLIGIFISSLVTATLATSIFLFLAIREQGLHFDREIARRLCAFEFPLVPAEVLAFISRQTERILVRFYISLSGAGILEMAYKFPPVLNMFFVAPFMLSWRTKSVELGDQPDAPQAMGRMLTRFVYLLLFGGLLLAVNISPVLVLLTPEEFWPAARIAQVDTATTVLAGLSTYMQFGIMYRRRTKQLALIKSIAAGIKVAISFFTIRTFGLSGAAYSALITEVVILTWISRVSQSLFHIEIQFGRLCVLILAAMGLFAGIQYVNYLATDILDSLASDVIPPLISRLQHSPLVSWKSGKLLAFLVGHERAVAELMFNTASCGGFLLFLPLLHPRGVRYLVGLRGDERVESARL